MFSATNSYAPYTPTPFYPTPSAGPLGEFPECSYVPSSGAPSGDFCTEPNLEVTPKDAEKWERFHKIGNEMIVSKSGRNPFPIFDFDVGGLDRDAEYRFAIAFERCDEKRYTHQDGRWTTHGRGEPLGEPLLNFHHKDSQSGRHWMREGVRFHQLRFTNNVQSTAKLQTIQLLSMHKYRAIVYVYRLNPNPVFAPQNVARFTFPMMEFIAVTAYQNGALKDLKVELNPFAKAFRKDGKHTTKRKVEKKVDEDEEDAPKKFRIDEDPCLPDFQFDSNSQNFPAPQPYQNNATVPYTPQNQYYESWNFASQGYPSYYNYGQMPQTQNADYGYNHMYPNHQLQYPQSHQQLPGPEEG